jgi:hypothetical protein
LYIVSNNTATETFIGGYTFPLYTSNLCFGISNVDSGGWVNNLSYNESYKIGPGLEKNNRFKLCFSTNITGLYKQLCVQYDDYKPASCYNGLCYIIEKKRTVSKNKEEFIFRSNHSSLIITYSPLLPENTYSLNDTIIPVNPVGNIKCIHERSKGTASLFAEYVSQAVFLFGLQSVIMRVFFRSELRAATEDKNEVILRRMESIVEDRICVDDEKECEGDNMVFQEPNTPSAPLTHIPKAPPPPQPQHAMIMIHPSSSITKENLNEHPIIRKLTHS